MSSRDLETRELGYFAIGILPAEQVQCHNCFSFVAPVDDECPGCGENICRVCGCSDSAACVGGCRWVDVDNRLCSRCVR